MLLLEYKLHEEQDFSLEVKMSSLETAKDTHVDENRIEILTEGKYFI